MKGGVFCALFLALASAVPADSDNFAANLTGIDMMTVEGTFSMEISDDNALTYTVNGVNATSAGLYVTPVLNNLTGGPLLLNLTSSESPQSSSIYTVQIKPSSMVQSTLQYLAQQIKVDNYNSNDDDDSGNTISADDLQDLLEDGIIYVEVNTTSDTLSGLIYKLNDDGSLERGDDFQEPISGATAPSGNNDDDDDNSNDDSSKSSSDNSSENDSDDGDNDDSSSNSNSDNNSDSDDGDSSNDSSDDDNSDDGSK